MKPIVFAITLLLSCTFIEAQVKVKVYKQDGAQSEYICSELAQLYFSEQGLMIDDGVTYPAIEIPRSDIRKITFTDEASNIAASAGKVFSIFPNPARSFISIQGAPEIGVSYAIYAADGRKLLSDVAPEAGKIDVGNLPAGLYFVKINNKPVKFIKL
ncbi:MAG: T9SS type A sorting domain-containing protein [Prevotella sp.]|jgi:hypothetical protein|nr:T9SS type A sorting domain-containing protein [Prevotella sp.]